MDSSSYLNPESIKAQCDAAIQTLQKDNDALHTVENSLDIFIDDSEIKSSAFDALKQQLNDYKTIIQAMETANELDIADYETLKGAVGDEILDGAVIAEQKQNAEITRKKNESSACFYRRQAFSISFSPLQFNYYQRMAAYYDCLVASSQQLYEKWQDKEEQYDAIEAAASGLFGSSEGLRETIQAGISDIGGAFRSGKYVPNMNAEWRMKIQIGEKEKFSQLLKKQFGFDDKTADIMWKIYNQIQKKYKEKSQIERDWYFARAISQLGDYNNKKVSFGPFKMETHAWRKGAGWAYKYEEEEKFYCDNLGLSKEEYIYLRQMIRLQHFMCSSPEKFDIDAVKALYTDDKKEFAQWKSNMEQTTGKEFSDEEYIKYYKTLYESMGNKGDYSHMMYTISSNLIEKGHKVDNKWKNWGAPSMSWNSAEVRQDIVGWLGDAVYTGNDNQVSFGSDDYIADLDADNIANRVNDNQGLMESMNQYYFDVSIDNSDKLRTTEFLENNPYEDVESAVFERIKFKDVNEDDKKDLEDLKNNETYKDTYEFLKKLKDIQEGNYE